MDGEICTHCVFLENCLSVIKSECGSGYNGMMGVASYNSLKYIKQSLRRGCQHYTPTTQKLVLDKLESIESLLISQHKSDEL